jgi:hypothetical protein
MSHHDEDKQAAGWAPLQQPGPPTPPYTTELERAKAQIAMMQGVLNSTAEQVIETSAALAAAEKRVAELESFKERMHAAERDAATYHAQAVAYQTSLRIISGNG